MNITITSCLYDIRKKEGSTCNDNKKIQDYLLLSRHMLSVRLPMVIFTDEEYIMDYVCKTRGEYGLSDMTIVKMVPFHHTIFYKDLDVLKNRMKDFNILNWNKEKDTPLYVLLNNNKFDFLQRTIDTNPFQTEFFFWMDMGIQHCTNATEEEWSDITGTWVSFIEADRTHIHQLRIHTVLKQADMKWKEYFNVIYHHIAGGLFGGYKECMKEYIRMFHDQWKKILYQEGWWQLDEAVMTIITETYPEKFRFFYGDYDGLLSNFIHSKKSFHLVLQTAQRFLDARNYKQAKSVLDTLDMRYLQKTGYYHTAIQMKTYNEFCLQHST